MARISCRWKTELDGVKLYDENGILLTHFIAWVMEAGDPELDEDIYCEWDGANIAYRWDKGIENKTYRTSIR